MRTSATEIDGEDRGLILIEQDAVFADPHPRAATPFQPLYVTAPIDGIARKGKLNRFLRR